MTTSPVVVQRRFYSVGEVALILGTTGDRVRRLIADGELRSTRLGTEGQGWHRIPVEDVERLIAGEEPAP